VEPQRAEPDAGEAFYFVANFVKHAPNLPVQSLLEHNAQASWAELLDADEFCPFTVEENPGAQFFGEFRLPEFVENDFVFLFDLRPWVGQVLREIAVAGQEQESFGLRVEPADVEEAGKFFGEQIVNCVGRVRIAPSADEAGRFVQHDRERFRRPNESAIDFDVIVRRDLRAEIGARLPVYGHAALRDELVAMPARAESGGGEETVEAQAA
jgi:hypothetical protein